MLLINNWNWVPYELESATSLARTFYSCAQQAADFTPELKNSFPQLQTSDSLLTVLEIWANSGITGWADANGNLTNQPFTNSSKVTNWQNAFANNGITSLGVDTQSAITLFGAFQGNYWITSPFFYAPNCTDFTSIFQKCKYMTTMNPSISNSTYSKGTNFNNAWYQCSALTSFPQIDTSSGTNFSGAWKDCSSLTSFPQIDTSSATSFSNAWYNCESLTSFPTLTLPNNCSHRQAWFYCKSLTSFPAMNFSGTTDLYQTWQNCSGLTSFPLIDTTGVTKLTSTWLGCTSLNDIGVVSGATTSFPLIDTSSVDQFNSTWYSCVSLTVFPEIDTSNGTNFYQAWYSNTSLVSFPSLDLSKGTRFVSTWRSCRALEDFPPNMFDTTGTLESNAYGNAFNNCALTAQSIENILVSLDTNGQSNIELTIDGGTNAGQSTWTAAANTAYTNLINKGWTITANP
jgi:hypothetical protein